MGLKKCIRGGNTHKNKHKMRCLSFFLYRHHLCFFFNNHQTKKAMECLLSSVRHYINLSFCSIINTFIRKMNFTDEEKSCVRTCAFVCAHLYVHANTYTYTHTYIYSHNISGLFILALLCT